MRLSAKLSLLVVFLLGGLVFMGFFGLYQMSQINDTSTELSANWLPGTNAVNQLNTLASDVRINEVSHVFNENPSFMKGYEKTIQTLLAQMSKVATWYAGLPKEPEEERIYQDFLGQWKEYRALNDKMLSLSTNLKTAEAIVILQGESENLYQEICKKLMRLVEINLKGGDNASLHANEMYHNSRWLVFMVLGIMSILGVVGGIVTVRGILRQLGKDPGELVTIAERVTSGDYRITDGSPTIGVYGNIVRMVEALETNIAKAQDESARAHQESLKAQEAMKAAEAASQQATAKTNAMLAAADQLEQVVAIVSSASEELSAQISQSEHGAADQAARVTETATAMEEMNSTVLEVAKNASAASDVSTNTRQKAEAGALVVQQSLNRIHKVRTQSMELKSDMEKLNEQAQSISQIMSVISDIADQTNLLALNAAIEAARAGEAGRGFAVVADEVRKLAEKTMASTTDVGNAIRSIQQSAAQNMAQVDNSVTLIEEATDYANQSGTALNEIVLLVDSTADQVRAIATASEQQSASSEEINESIAQVNVIAGQTARAMQEASRAVMELSKQSQVLGGMIERMKE